MDDEMMQFLKNKLKSKCDIGLVGGSDLGKITEQMGGKLFSKLITPQCRRNFFTRFNTTLFCRFIGFQLHFS